MNSKPMVSIIMNCYNSELFLREAIDSVYAQTYTNWELIFWDNASTDSSAEIARSYDYKVKYYLADKTTPLGEARNYAIQKATGQYIAFLDCDDIYMPNKLELQIGRMEGSRHLFSYGSAIIINSTGKELRKEFVKNKSGNVFGQLLDRYEINMQSSVLHKDIFEKYGFSFNQSYQYCPDYDLFMRIAAKEDIEVVKECLVRYRKLDNSLSSRTYHLIHQEMTMTLDDLFQDRSLYYKYQDSANRAYRMMNYYKAIPYIDKGDYRSARSFIAKILMMNIKYFILYLLLFLPFPPKIIMKRIVG